MIQESEGGGGGYRHFAAGVKCTSHIPLHQARLPHPLQIIFQINFIAATVGTHDSEIPLHQCFWGRVVPANLHLPATLLSCTHPPPPF
jgi:hypothetical protein